VEEHLCIGAVRGSGGQGRQPVQSGLLAFVAADIHTRFGVVGGAGHCSGSGEYTILFSFRVVILVH
jgi:hypothetical protein